MARRIKFVEREDALIGACALVLLVIAAFAARGAPAPNESEATYQSAPVASVPAGSPRIPILIYHSVHPIGEGATPAQITYNVPPDIFESQMAYLRDHGYTPISLDEAVREINAGTTTPIQKPVVLTFDDGWQNEYLNAFPVLRSFGFTATFFVYTHPISEDVRFMSWDELREMSAAGMDIGSHTLTHPHLSTISEAQLQSEIFDSKKILEKELGHPVVDFATPFGYSNPHIEALAKAAGYATLRTVYRGNKQSNPYHLTGYIAPNTLTGFIYVLEKAP